MKFAITAGARVEAGNVEHSAVVRIVDLPSEAGCGIRHLRGPPERAAAVESRVGSKVLRG